MIITQLVGGLGNQMFQYAAGKALALTNQDKLILDLSQFKNYHLRKYRLECFNIQNNFIVNNLPLKLKIVLLTKKYSPITSFLSENILNWHVFQETTPNILDPIFFQLKGNIYLQGYWQTENYFKKFSKQIKKDFTFKQIPTGENLKIALLIQKSQSVAIHIRRGDYAYNQKTRAFHGLCSSDYYLQAMSLIEKTIRNPVYYVFSDDIDWCKKNIKIDGKMHYITDDNNDWQDLQLMSMCKHQIIANSSFSWWGAWLNKNPNKIVIAPKKWFKINRKSYNLLPKKWIKIYSPLD